MKQIQVSKTLALEAAKAFEYVAQNEAGQSQAPNLFRREDTHEWQQAKKLRKLVKEAGN